MMERSEGVHLGEDSMKFCGKCKTHYKGEHHACSTGGGVHAPNGAPPGVPPETLLLESTQSGALEDTSALAIELADMMFKVCGKCHMSFGGEIDLCPEDGTRLHEHSMLARQTLALGAASGTQSIHDLKKYCPKCKSRHALHEKSCRTCGAPLVIPTQGGGPLAEATFELMGMVIADKYRLLQDIGAGGFGSVYLAKHEALGKQFAVKVLKSQLSGDTSFRDRFHEEALKLSRLEDENIVKVIDFGEWNDFQYMVTEYVDGKDLTKVIYGERLSPLRAAKIMSQVASALAEAHAKKIVHLDLKPANILVSQKRGRDSAKVIDFGIAEIFSETGGRRQQSICGTCSYMAPEQWRKEHLDPRTDVYSFGIILYECLAARPPFRHHLLSEYEDSHCRVPPPPLRKFRTDVPPEIEKLVHRCLEKDPAKRMPSAEAVEEALLRFVRSIENPLGRWVKRIGALAAVLGLAAAITWSVVEYRRDREAPTWSGWSASAGEIRLKERDDSTDAVKKFQTREEMVEVKLEARDNREVAYLSATSGAWVGEKRFPGSTAAIELKLDLGDQQVDAWAFDRSGNPSSSIRLVIRRLPAVPAQPVAVLPSTRTHQESVTIPLESAAEAKAIVECTNGGQTIFTREVELKPDEPQNLPVALKPGENTIVVKLVDKLDSAERASQKMEVSCNPRPLTVKPTMRPLEGKHLEYDEKQGSWLSQGKKVKVVIDVEDAKHRFEEGSQLHVQVNEDIPLLPTWKSEDLEAGQLSVEVTLVEGKNIVAVESMKEDRFGILFEKQTLEIHCDPSPPVIELVEQSLDYFSRELPWMKVRVTEKYPGKGQEAPILVDADQNPLDPGSFQVEKLEAGLFKLTFLEDAAFHDDGSHPFAIAARDRIGNKAAKEFTVFTDHDPPKIEIRSPAKGRTYKRNETIEISALVTDAGTGNHQVEAEATVVAPGIRKTKKFPLKPGTAEHEYVVSIPINETESGLKKPGTFDKLEPTFDITIRAVDRARNLARSSFPLGFAWENKDRFLWKKDGSVLSVLVYHEACRYKKNDVPAFWMATTEVTNGQFERYLKAEGRTGGSHAPRSPEWKDGSCPAAKLDLPARGLSPLEMEAYAKWAGLAIPRRSEWEAAAYWNYRDRVERQYPWGDEWPASGSPVWADHDSPRACPKDGQDDAGRTPFGLADMLGNVWELARDDATSKAVALGGGYDRPETVLRDKRFERYLHGESGFVSPGERRDNLGFRCVLESKGTRP
jgi:serine/threonine protein kinase